MTQKEFLSPRTQSAGYSLMVVHQHKDSSKGPVTRGVAP
jgi:hypothetical protein